MAAPQHPAQLHEPDAGWPPRAGDLLAEVRAAMIDLPGAETATFDHIGSTSVPRLRAKPYLDLQIRIDPLPAEEALTACLAPLGYRRARGARPDSPGVDRDLPRGDEDVPDAVWEKLLYFAAQEQAILHVRRTDSPWGRYTVWFRDWLRAHPPERQRYEAVKTRLSAQNAGKADYDDYTRAKTAYFDEVQPVFTAWARASDDLGLGILARCPSPEASSAGAGPSARAGCPRGSTTPGAPGRR